MKKMKKLIIFSLLVMVSMCVFSQQSKKPAYEIKFNNIDQFEVKKIVGILYPILEERPALSEDLQTFYYASKNKITEEELKNLLKENQLENKLVLFKKEEE